MTKRSKSKDKQQKTNGAPPAETTATPEASMQSQQSSPPEKAQRKMAVSVGQKVTAVPEKRAAAVGERMAPHPSGPAPEQAAERARPVETPKPKKAPAPRPKKPAAETAAAPLSNVMSQVEQDPAPAPVQQAAKTAPVAPAGTAASATLFEDARARLIAFNCKLLQMARQNVNSGLDHLKDMVGAKTPMEAARLQIAHWDERLKVLASQGEELRKASAALFACRAKAA